MMGVPPAYNAIRPLEPTHADLQVDVLGEMP